MVIDHDVLMVDPLCLKRFISPIYDLNLFVSWHPDVVVHGSQSLISLGDNTIIELVFK